MRNTGFTLLETLMIIFAILGIVFAILGIFFGIIIPQFLGESRSMYDDDNNTSVTISSAEDDARPSITYGDKQLVEMEVLVPSDCSQIREVIYITSEGEKKKYKIEVDAVWMVTPNLSLVEVLWEPLDWRQMPDVVLLHDSKSSGLLHDIKKQEQ